MNSFMLQLVRYLTNAFVAHIPCYAVRHFWYRRVIGMSVFRNCILDLST